MQWHENNTLRNLRTFYPDENNLTSIIHLTQTNADNAEDDDNRNPHDKRNYVVALFIICSCHRDICKGNVISM